MLLSRRKVNETHFDAKHGGSKPQAATHPTEKPSGQGLGAALFPPSIRWPWPFVSLRESSLNVVFACRFSGTEFSLLHQIKCPKLPDLYHQSISGMEGASGIETPRILIGERGCFSVIEGHALQTGGQWD
jgi:hypothetical protein